MKKYGIRTFAVIMICCAFTAGAQNTFPVTGNVGIGTLSPGSPLEVRRDQNLETVVNVSNQAAGVNAKARYQLTTLTPASYVLQELQDFAGSPGFLFSTGPAVRGAFYQAKEFYFQNLSGATNFKINSSGQVTIGTVPSTPGTYKLFVEGGLLTEKAKVALKSGADWADHVFAENYKLMPLEQVAEYIRRHKHLPGLPSAEKLVQEGGIDVNQMFAKQMEKIEELTLYLIELKKENQELRAMIETAVKNTAPANNK